MSDTSNKVTVALVVVLIFTSLMMILVREPFPSSHMAHNEMIPTQPGSEIGSAMSKFLWDYRGMDLTFQTLILFTTAICCLALLREELKH